MSSLVSGHRDCIWADVRLELLRDATDESNGPCVRLSTPDKES